MIYSEYLRKLQGYPKYRCFLPHVTTIRPEVQWNAPTMSDDETDTDLPEDDDEGMYERLLSHDSADGFHRHERFAHTERLASQGRHMHHPCGKWALTKLGPFYCAVAVCVCVVSAFWLLDSCDSHGCYANIATSGKQRHRMQPWDYLGLVLSALLMVLVCGGVGMGVSAILFGLFKCIRLLHGWAKSQARHDQQTPPTP